MANHGCSMCRSSGTVHRLLPDNTTEAYDCPGCDGKGEFEAPEDQWSRKHISLPWNKKKGADDAD